MSRAVRTPVRIDEDLVIRFNGVTFFEANDHFETETARAYDAGQSLPFPQRLIEAMRSGEAAGGDKRGKQSAALVIYDEDEWSALDLRVDDHADPLAELERLEQVSRERWMHFRQFLPTRKNPAGITDRDIIDAGIEAPIAGDR